MAPATATPFTDLISVTAGVVVILSGVFAGIARVYAILRGAAPDRVERVTAVGFLVGAALAVVLLEGEFLWS